MKKNRLPLNYDAYAYCEYLGTYQSAGRANARVYRATGKLPNLNKGNVVLIRSKVMGSQPMRILDLTKLKAAWQEFRRNKGWD